jgi:hypothetical protein
MSGAPLRVHAVDIFALFIAFVIPGLIANNKEVKKQYLVWLFGGVFGLLFWDVLSSYVIVKREIFMGWYIIYPVGLSAFLILHLLVKYINSKLAYNKSFKMDAAKRRTTL